MILDGHIHIGVGDVNRTDLIARLNSTGISGGVLLSIPPNFYRPNGKIFTAEERLSNLLSWTGSQSDLFPFYWIDPMEGDALDQVDMANKHGVKGFKVICSYFYPGDKKAMGVYAAIAKTGKPILFHSGILWDGFSSSKYNRPGEFEALLDIDGLRFSLAHVSWPWCDENIAVYGKFLNAYTERPNLSVEMFIDITPGTPPIYREEVLTKLFTIGYDVENNVIFGTDSFANNYNNKWVEEWIQRDNVIYKKLCLSSEIINKVYSENLKRLLGMSEVNVQKRYLRQGE